MTEGLKFCSWYLQNTLFLPFSDILLICLIPVFPVVWNCPTRANFAVYFYPMNLLWLLGYSQGTSPAGFRAIWMKSSPPKAGTMASTSCHTFKTTHVADNPLKTAQLLQTQLRTASHQEVWAQKSMFLFYLFIYLFFYWELKCKADEHKKWEQYIVIFFFSWIAYIELNAIFHSFGN